MKWTLRSAFATAIVLTVALTLGCGGDDDDNDDDGGSGATALEIGTYGGTAVVSYVAGKNEYCDEFGPIEFPINGIPVCSGDATDATGSQGFDDCTYNETSSGATFSCTGTEPVEETSCTENYQASGSVEILSSTRMRITMDYRSTISGPEGCAERTDPCTMHMVITLSRTSSQVDCDSESPRGVLDVLRAGGFGGLR